MKAILHSIEPHTTRGDWQSFVDNPSVDPWDAHGSFTLRIGSEGSLGADLFDVNVSTSAAAGRARGKARYFRGILVEQFTAEVVERTLREYVEGLKGNDWQQILDQLRKVMHWEYEGMYPPH
ncbi:Imm8 family immunity protein [Anatilimnocola floriformis]|uniref:Imm8 family immunity protein n=1 Tax=Anatilimnocola floriformis TaxID=2948575 RepID=UPI0020C4800B|nr:Imm8 family immunity protein [Anatilimnocola floriformis]